MLVGALALFAGCGREQTAKRSGAELESRSPAAGRSDQRFPELLNVRPIHTGPRTYDFMVMVSSPYDSPERYADGWRVLTVEGSVLGVKRLAHPHPHEQPFWRRQTRVRVPTGVRRVQLEGHDSRNGFGGKRLAVTLP